MSSDALPISPSRFAAALSDLPLSSLHLKAAELRNSIAHLDYSNEQLKPFAEGTNGSPDADCLDAIRENEGVIERMVERLRLLKKEVVEVRGQLWTEGISDSIEETEPGVGGGTVGGVYSSGGMTNGESANGRETSSAWTDGTFTTGRIINGEVVMNGASISAPSTSAPATNGPVGGRLDDEALRRAMEERMREHEEDDGDGMHL